MTLNVIKKLSFSTLKSKEIIKDIYVKSPKIKSNYLYYKRLKKLQK
jgi:hypothetical protein